MTARLFVFSHGNFKPSLHMTLPMIVAQPVIVALRRSDAHSPGIKYFSK